MSILLFLTAVVLSGIAAYYSVIGLIAIFSAAAIPVAIMGGSLELAKLVVASWLYRYWQVIPLLMKTYFTSALVVLMLITSMGIFGFLSKAHSDQSLVSGDVLSKIAVYDEKIRTAKDNIDANRKALKQMDEAVDQVMGRSTTEAGVDKAVAIRRQQARERDRLIKDIAAEQKTITKLNEEAAPIRAEVRKVEAEVGPLKYIAALIYGDNPDENTLERAVRWLIILLICVFDPLAVLMLIAANLTQMRQAEWRKEKEEKEKLIADPPKEEKIDDIKNEIIPNQTELPVASETPEQSEPQKDNEQTVVAAVSNTTQVETVGVIAEQPAAPEIITGEPGTKKKTREYKPVEEVIVPPSDNTNNSEQPIEQTEQAKSISVEAKPSLETQIQTMITNDDAEGLEEVYKKIVKELAKKNRTKSTHWGPLR